GGRRVLAHPADLARRVARGTGDQVLETGTAAMPGLHPRHRARRDDRCRPRGPAHPGCSSPPPRRPAPRRTDRPGGPAAPRAARFLSLWRGASADELEQAAAEWQTPYYEGHRTPEGDAEQGAFAEVITAALERLRASERAQTASASQPQEGTEVSTDTAQDRS